MFKITDGKGFQVTFDNGFTLSVQFGPGAYCDNKNEPFCDQRACGEKGSSDAEIAIMHHGEFVGPEYKAVHGYISADQVARLAFEVAQATCEPEVISAINKLYGEVA